MNSNFIDEKDLCDRLNISIPTLRALISSPFNSKFRVKKVNNNYYINKADIPDINQEIVNDAKEWARCVYGTYLNSASAAHYMCFYDEYELKEFTKPYKSPDLEITWCKDGSFIYPTPKKGWYNLKTLNFIMRCDIEQKHIKSVYFHRILDDRFPIFPDDARYLQIYNLTPRLIESSSQDQLSD